MERRDIMTVAELIEELRKYPADMPIVTYASPDYYYEFSAKFRLKKLYRANNILYCPKEYPREDGDEEEVNMLCI